MKENKDKEKDNSINNQVNQLSQLIQGNQVSPTNQAQNTTPNLAPLPDIKVRNSKTPNIIKELDKKLNIKNNYNKLKMHDRISKKDDLLLKKILAGNRVVSAITRKKIDDLNLNVINANHRHNSPNNNGNLINIPYQPVHNMPSIPNNLIINKPSNLNAYEKDFFSNAVSPSKYSKLNPINLRNQQRNNKDNIHI